MILKIRILRQLSIFIAVFSLLFVAIGTGKAAEKYDTSLYKTMKWRCIGPYRGGRVTAVCGVPGDPLMYYFGATGGGVWKTEDAGLTWKPISDGQFKTGSVGAIAVAESDLNVVYVGMGESSLRNDISHGDGVYKSEDGGRSWKNVGLRNSRHIGRIRIHPRNPDLVYVAVLGHIYGPSEEGGIYRSKDGGGSWKKVLYVDDKTGAIDLSMDSTNPRILYASMWQVKMAPWGIFSGGPGSGLYKSTNAGDTWVELTEGLPKGPKGRIGVSVSPVNPDRVWAIVEADDGGLFRSDNGGKTWHLVSSDSFIRCRHSYYTHIFADTQDPDTVYVLTRPIAKSVDGGKTFERIRVPHGDMHDLWIAPENKKRMIVGDDGGASVSLNGGETWSSIYNQPTASFYHVNTDNQFPYHVYGAQQDNTTVCIASRTSGLGITQTDWYPVAGCESGHIAVHPKEPSISFGSCFWGSISRYDRRTGETRDISPFPIKPMGLTGAELKYRFTWTSPLVMSPYDPDTLYAGSNVLFKTTDQGQSWVVISPDLTRNDKSKQEDVLSHMYCTIFAIVESPLQRDLIWVGSDDGLIHITTDGGKNWQNVTPKMMPEWSRVSIIEASSHDAATAYAAVNRWELADHKPYIYKTSDYGRSWRLITKGIPGGDFVRVVREDPKRKSLLYAGTETGIYVSFDDGESWQSLQLNLPAVPVHDLAVKEDDLVAATHGRSFWILDDLTLLHQLTSDVVSSKAYLFKPWDTYRMKTSMRRIGASTGVGQNPPGGVVVQYYLKEKPEEEIILEFLDEEGKAIKAFRSKERAKEEVVEDPYLAFFGGGSGSTSVSAEAGMNRFEWDMRYPDARGIKGGTTLFMGNLRGPRALPSTYQIRLTVGSESHVKSFEIKKDPRISASQEEFQEQFDFLIKIRDRLSAAHDAVNQILGLHRDLKATLELVKGLDNEKVITEEAKKLDGRLASVLNEIVATRIRESKDLNFAIYNANRFDSYAPFIVFAPTLKLNSRIANIQGSVSSVDGKPTDQCYENFNVLSAELDKQITELKEIIEKDVPAFNKLVDDQGIPAIPVQK
jgi:photosystem II stability/assembly factor-like uncharacterized protein